MLGKRKGIGSKRIVRSEFVLRSLNKFVKKYNRTTINILVSVASGNHENLEKIARKAHYGYKWHKHKFKFGLPKESTKKCMIIPPESTSF